MDRKEANKKYYESKKEKKQTVNAVNSNDDLVSSLRSEITILKHQFEILKLTHLNELSNLTLKLTIQHKDEMFEMYKSFASSPVVSTPVPTQVYAQVPMPVSTPVFAPLLPIESTPVILKSKKERDTSNDKLFKTCLVIDHRKDKSSFKGFGFFEIK